MTGTKIVTDSACDLPDQLLNDLGIGLVPLRVRFGQEEFVDRAELSAKEFWARCATETGLPETSAPAPGAFCEEFSRMADQGAEAVVCVCLSSKLSATAEAARQAARQLESSLRVEVVDSLSVTMGEGLVVWEAANVAARGGNTEQVLEAAHRAVSTMKVYGAIDTLENLKKGGRIGAAQALLGSLLAIKPVIEVRDGVVHEESKQRTRARSLRYLADKVRRACPVARLAAFSADASDFDEFLQMLSEVTTPDELVVGDIGPVIGTHAGRGAIGVAWLPA